VKVLYLSGAIVLLDQMTKMLVKGFSLPLLGISVEGMHYGESIPILGSLLRLTYIENPGMAFGITLGAKPFFAIVSIIASLVIVVYLHRSRREPLLYRASIAMILGGAVGNLIDRVFYGVLYGQAPLFQGRVVDFFDVDFPDMNLFGYQLNRWPVFNIADASVTIGVILLLILSSRKSPTPSAAPSASPLRSGSSEQQGSA